MSVRSCVSCSGAAEPPGAEDAELAAGEELYILFKRPSVQIPLTVKTFGKRSLLTLEQVPVHVVSPNAVVANSEAGDELAKKQLQKVVSEMRITKKIPVVE